MSSSMLVRCLLTSTFSLVPSFILLAFLQTCSDVGSGMIVLVVERLLSLCVSGGCVTYIECPLDVCLRFFRGWLDSSEPLTTGSVGTFMRILFIGEHPLTTHKNLVDQFAPLKSHTAILASLENSPHKGHLQYGTSFQDFYPLIF